jgi:hypothetical protein
MTDTPLHPITEELRIAISNSAWFAVNNNISKDELVAKVLGAVRQAFDEQLHNARVLDASRPNIPQASCRVLSHESDQRGRCLRCGTGVGEPCGEEVVSRPQ